MNNSDVFFGRYKCIKKIGTGGMSEVYLCTDIHIGKKWAMKAIKARRGFTQIAKSEIALLKSLDYKSFPRITDAFMYDGRICIVTDFIDGKTLSSIIKESGALPKDVIFEYFLTLTQALNYLHSLNPPILYLDMKPSNIMIKNDGSLQLIDFGIAQTILTKGRGLGSIGYSPPEQYAENAVLDGRSDVFALGMTMYALSIGREITSDYGITIKQIRNDKSIDPQLKKLILKCVAYDKNDRLTGKELENALLHIKNKKKGIRLAAYETVMICVVFFALLAVLFSKYKAYEAKKYADEMLKKASLYVTDDGYSKQGIKIICGYIDGNFLDEKTEEYFTYEAARNYFEIQRDYVSAKRYFERLPQSKYPEVKYFIRLCRLLTGFGSDRDGINDVIYEFRQYNNSLEDSDTKRKNEEMLELISSENNVS